MADALTRIGPGLLLPLLVALATGAPAQAEPLRLSGVIVAGDERVAIFARGSGEAMLVVRLGDRLGDRRVSAIAAHGVTLSGPDDEAVIVLGEDASARAALAAAAPPPPPFLDPYRRERETENDQ